MSGKGFFNEFAYGFSKTAEPMIQDQAKAQAEADAKIREKIASVAPEADLFKRDEEVKAAILAKQKKDDMDQFATFMQNNGGGTTTPQPTSPQGSNLTAPSPTITQSATPAVSMAPTAATPTSQDDAFARQQKHTFFAAAADAAGLPHMAKGFSVAAQLDKNEYEHNKDLATEAEKPVTSAEGINVVEQLGKDTDNNIKASGKSIYRTGNLSVSLADPNEAQKEQEIFETIHAPLAQSFLEAQKLQYPNAKVTVPYGSIKKQTTQATQDIVTLTSDNPRISPEDKAKANKDLSKIFSKVYGSPENLQKIMSKDYNIAGVMDIITSANKEQPSAVQPASNSNNSAIQDGATATNPKTGEKMIFDGGEWKPITPEATR